LARGNKVYNNQSGIRGSQNVAIFGNTVHGHKSSIFSHGIFLSGTFGIAEVARNVVFDNRDGIVVNGTPVIRENRVYGQTSWGINAANSEVRSNVVYNNPTGVLLGASQALVSNNLVYNNVNTGFLVAAGGPDLINNTVYQTSGNAIRIEASGGVSASGVILRNNLLWAQNSTGISITNDSQSGFVSDYNLIHPSGTGIVGQWLGVNYSALNGWQIATARDTNSLSNDPLFVDSNGADNILGYVAGGTDGSDDDFHLQSAFGSLHGGSLAPVRSGVTGLPVFPVGVLTNDPGFSPGIDRGSTADAFANEPPPNGGYINIGYDGNTSQASLSPAAYLLMFDPNGGEIISQGSTFPIRWRANGFAGNVTLEYSSSGPAGPFQILAANEPNDGAYDWLVNAGTFVPSANYALRILSVDQPSIADVSDADFQVTTPNTTYYVNDSSTTGDEYTTAIGDVANTGQSPASPLNSIQAVLNTYDLGPGDVIYVDTGTYSVTTNIVIAAADSGVRIQGPVQGTNQAALNRGSTATGSYLFHLQNATAVTLDSLEIFGANQAVLVDLSSHDFLISNSIVRNNFLRGIHVEVGALRATIANNEVLASATAFEYAIEVEGDDALVRDNIVRNNSGATGIYVSDLAANVVVRGNNVFGNTLGIYAVQPSLTQGRVLIEQNLSHDNP
jgi:hypothetical protein